jgi:hypothetical protein
VARLGTSAFLRAGRRVRIRLPPAESLMRTRRPGMKREVGFSAHLNYREPGGSAAERDTAAAWLHSRVADAHGDRLVIWPGTQNALFNLLVALTKPGDVVLTEALTYPGIKAAALPRIGLPTTHPCREIVSHEQAAIALEIKTLLEGSEGGSRPKAVARSVQRARCCPCGPDQFEWADDRPGFL